MRELKVRVWSKIFKMFAPDSANITIQGDDAGVYFDFFNGNFNTEWWSLKDCEIIQYTGLKDKNGREVFEGDIIIDSFQSMFILYCEKCKSYQAAFYGAGCSACSVDFLWRDVVERAGDIEVIGNIYENPELLGQSK